MRRASFQVARVERQRRPPFPESSRWTRFRVYARFSRNPRTEHPGKIFVTAGLQGWTPFQACKRTRLLGSLHTHVNVGPCTFCRCDPVAKDSRQIHCDRQSPVSEHRTQAVVTEAFCGAPTVVDIALEGVGEGSHLTKERLTPDTSMSNCCSPGQTHVLCRLSQLSRRLHSA